MTTPRPTSSKNDYAGGLVRLWQAICPDLPAPEREYRFDARRRWRFDLAWPAAKLAVEVEGILRTPGRHQRLDGYRRDCEKYRAAVLAGWKLLRYTTGELRDDPVGAVEEVADLLRRLSAPRPAAS